MTPYKPIYIRPPNKFSGYYVKTFWGGELRIAKYKDKKGRECEMVAQVLWK